MSFLGIKKVVLRSRIGDYQISVEVSIQLDTEATELIHSLVQQSLSL